jgi:hypothetical protein
MTASVADANSSRASSRPRGRGGSAPTGLTALDRLEWRNSFLIEGDVPSGVAGLKEQDGPELQVQGSAQLIQTMLAHTGNASPKRSTPPS